MASFVMIHEVQGPHDKNQSCLCFQWGRYEYDDDTPEMGYRFIWRSAEGQQLPHRGQARIPSAKDLLDLLAQAQLAGWFVTCEEGPKTPTA
jgi:hypothetical protein